MPQQPVLPADKVNTLQVAVHDACVAAAASLAHQTTVYSAEQISRPAQNRNRNGAPTVFSLVVDAVWSTLQSYAQEQNAVHSAATRLSPEILCEIFAHLSFKGRISTSHVCHKWRDASLAFPARLWSTIPDTTRLQRMDALLARTAARGLPVDLMRIHRDVSDQSGVELGARMIAKHMVHIRTLKLCLGTCTFDQVCKFADALRTAAPLLRTFCMMSLPSTNQDEMLLAWQRIFSGHAPLLQHAEFHGCWRYLLLFRDFASIRSITLLDLPFYARCPVWQALHSFPLLERLKIHVDPYPWRNEGKIVLPGTVTHLAIAVDSGKDLAHLDVTQIDAILLICISVSPHVLYVLPTPLAALEIEPFLQHPFHPDSMVATFDMLGTSAWRRKFGFSAFEQEDFATTRSRKTRTFTDVDYEALSHPSIWTPTFGSVTALVLYFGRYSAAKWPKMHVAVCDNVKDLTIQHLHWNKESIAEPMPSGMTFPGLRTLTLLATYLDATPKGDAAGVAFDSDDVKKMVGGLGYLSPKLQQLGLRGLDVLPRSALHDIADDVRFEEGRAEVPDLQQSPYSMDV